MTARRGRFITVEGIEGAGKSTNIAYLGSLLADAGKEVVNTREPGGTALGEELRRLLLGHRHDDMADDTELLLMFAARAEHLSRVIRPALAQGLWVLCDRFTDATFAYQGGGRGIPHAHIAALEQWVQGELRPDLTLLLDVPADVGLQRAGQRSDPDRFEQLQGSFFRAVRDAYLAIASAEPARVKVIDASGSLVAVQRQIRGVISDFLARSA